MDKPNPSQPRNIGGTYPLAGARVGPAWRIAWRHLADQHPHWVPRASLVATMASTGILPETAERLLKKARKVGVLEARYRQTAGRGQRRTEYRIAR